MFRAMDLNQGGEVDLHEFLAATLSRSNGYRYIIYRERERQLNKRPFTLSGGAHVPCHGLEPGRRSRLTRVPGGDALSLQRAAAQLFALARRRLLTPRPRRRRIPDRRRPAVSPRKRQRLSTGA